MDQTVNGRQQYGSNCERKTAMWIQLLMEDSNMDSTVNERQKYGSNCEWKTAIWIQLCMEDSNMDLTVNRRCRNRHDVTMHRREIASI